MKNLLLLIPFCFLSISGNSQDEKQLISSINNLDVKKTKSILNKLESLNPEIKAQLEQDIKKNIERYETETKNILKSKKDMLFMLIGSFLLYQGIAKLPYILSYNGLDKLAEKFTDEIITYYNNNFQPSQFPVELKEAYKKITIYTWYFVNLFCNLYGPKLIYGSWNCSSAKNKLSKAQEIYNLICKN